MNAPTNPWEGRELGGGRYLVGEKLGEGGMAYVHRALDRHLDTDVVLKIPKASLLEQPDFVLRFQREARSLVKLSHPHIVKVLDCGEWEGRPYLVLQYLGGGSLSDVRPRDVFDNCQPVEVSTLEKWLPSVASALDFMHEQSFMHRDVKPGNILFDVYYHAYLSDFGIVKALGDVRGSSQLTGMSLVLGTPDYMAPEMIRGMAFDGRADQYALAVTVYEMLAGRRPFEGPTVASILIQHTNEEACPLKQLGLEIPIGLSNAVERAMSKLPGSRFSTCRSFARAVLSALPKTSGTTVRPSQVVEEPPAPPVESPANVSLVCPHCTQHLLIPTSLGGQQARCSYCKCVVYVAAELTELFAEPPHQSGYQEPSEFVPHRTSLPSGESKSSEPTLDVGVVSTTEGPLSSGVIHTRGQSGKDTPSQAQANVSTISEVPQKSGKSLPARTPSSWRHSTTRPNTLTSQKSTSRLAGTLLAVGATVLVTFAAMAGLWMAFGQGHETAPDVPKKPPQETRSDSAPHTGTTSKSPQVAELPGPGEVKPPFVEKKPAEDKQPGEVKQPSSEKKPGEETKPAENPPVNQMQDSSRGPNVSDVPKVVDVPHVPLKPPPASMKETPPDSVPEIKQEVPPVATIPPSIQNSVGMTLLYVPPGRFVQGSPANDVGPEAKETSHPVKLTQGFYCGRTEVTVGQFKIFVREQGYLTQAERAGQGGWGYNPNVEDFERTTQFHWKNPGWPISDEHPVTNVSWFDAQSFCEWLSSREKAQYRLPTEAEWEYLCRAGTATTYATGTNLAELYRGANVQDHSLRKYFPTRCAKIFPKLNANAPSDGYAFAAPAGKFPPNAWGFCDLVGNVSEWCQDWVGDYPVREVTDPTGPALGESRVIRGGSWMLDPEFARSAKRNGDAPTRYSDFVGFRVVRIATP